MWSFRQFRRHLLHSTLATSEDYTALLDFIWREIVVGGKSQKDCCDHPLTEAISYLHIT